MENKNLPKTQRSPARGNKAMLFFLLYLVVLQFMVAVIWLLGSLLGFNFENLISMGIVHFFGIFVPFLFYLIFTRQKQKDVLKWNPLGIKKVMLLIAISLAIIPMVQIISRLSAFIFFPVINEIMLNLSAYPIWLSLLVIAVFPALFEEFFCRGALYVEFEKLPLKKLALITGLFFGIMHLNFHQAIYTGVVGVLYAYILYYTRSIWGPILMHFVNNGLFVLLSQSDAINNWQDELWESPLHFLLIWGGIALVLLPVFVICFKKIKAGFAAPEEATGAEEPKQGEEELKQGEEKPKVFTWAFWVVIALFLIFGGLMELSFRLIT